MKLVSACLIGLCCNYLGKHNSLEILLREAKTGNCIPVCPEQLGGLSTPRLPAEIIGGCAQDVLNGRAKVLCSNGKDVTGAFIIGATEVLKLARLIQPECVILKEKSPSCGVYKVYDGSHSDKLIQGCGVTTALLKNHGFHVLSDVDIDPTRI
jgi:uncharacterized protein YbbK (DUF523 family)